jgi:hypothetical protein
VSGNASQVSDGAAAVLLARRSVANRLGLPIIGKFVTAAVVGVPPRIMGVGPAFAIPKVSRCCSEFATFHSTILRYKGFGQGWLDERGRRFLRNQ